MNPFRLPESGRKLVLLTTNSDETFSQCYTSHHWSGVENSFVLIEVETVTHQTRWLRVGVWVRVHYSQRETDHPTRHSTTSPNVLSDKIVWISGQWKLVGTNWNARQITQLGTRISPRQNWDAKTIDCVHQYLSLNSHCQGRNPTEQSSSS